MDTTIHERLRPDAEFLADMMEMAGRPQRVDLRALHRMARTSELSAGCTLDLRRAVRLELRHNGADFVAPVKGDCSPRNQEDLDGLLGALNGRLAQYQMRWTGELLPSSRGWLVNLHLHKGEAP